MVLDHLPDADEIEDLAEAHLEDYPAEQAYATVELLHRAPDWLSIHEQDQMNAFLRDDPNACILVVYMQEGDIEDEDEDEEDDE
jgi:hypothetical protein